MARTRRVTTDSMTQVEAYEAIKNAGHLNYILVSDVSQATGVSELTIRKQIDKDRETGRCDLGFDAFHWSDRYSVDRLSFIAFKERGCQGGNTD